MLPSQGGDQLPLLPIGVGPPDWGPALGPYLTLWLFLVSLVGVWPSGESECQSEREPGIP